MSYENIPRISVASFKNSRKEKPNQPDFTGFGQVDNTFVESVKQIIESGVEEVPLRIAGWNKTSKKGNNFISYSIQIDTYQLESKNNDEDEAPF
jgi:hypothetical protein